MCYAGNEYGKYGILETRFCGMTCKMDDHFKCGGRYANSVYDITNYEHPVNCQDKPPKDCSKRGGLYEGDKC